MAQTASGLNWPAVLADLKAGGYSQHKLAIVMNCPQTRVWRWAHGLDEPSYSEGSKLLDLRASLALLAEEGGADTSGDVAPA